MTVKNRENNETPPPLDVSQLLAALEVWGRLQRENNGADRIAREIKMS